MTTTLPKLESPPEPVSPIGGSTDLLDKPSLLDRADTRRESASEFRPLSDRIRALGLLRPRKAWYARYAVLLGLAIAAIVVGLVMLAGSPWVLALAPAAALVWVQVSYLGHDIGHHQVTQNKLLMRGFGLGLGNLLTGLSFGWWMDKHTRHHANPNHEGQDPDVGEGIISWSDRQQAKKTGFARLLSRHQAVLFFPLLTFEGWQLQVAGLRNLRARPVGARRIEGTLLAVHHLVYFGGLLLLLGPVHAAIFIAIHQALWGFLLGAAFAPNHKGMPMPPPGSKLNHLRKQVLTARDVLGGPVVDFMLGGLNQQITHHLFPSMARPHLKIAQPIVAAYCAEIGLPYRACGVVESYKQCLTHLETVGHSS
jgi:fatty acid desaturase